MPTWDEFAWAAFLYGGIGGDSDYQAIRNPPDFLDGLRSNPTDTPIDEIRERLIKGFLNHWHCHVTNNEHSADEIRARLMISQFGKRSIGVIISLHQWTWSPVFSDTNGVHGLGMPVWLYTNQPGITQQQAASEFFVKNADILPGYSVQQGFIDAWKKIIGRYSNNLTVIGADLFNEPPNQFNPATTIKFRVPSLLV
ncbi:MAG: cellulase family glycosylhydrolase [Bacteroidetes bacterium]|nr:cellulase family glycosylhydrolase [Bacteroidota bacterium]MCL5738294.1 cellulase family glycosylhydrolase [Bacteroidota bacterium]